MDNKTKGNKYGIISLILFAVNFVTCFFTLIYFGYINTSTSGLAGLIVIIIAIFIIVGSTLTSVVTCVIGFVSTRSKITILAIFTSIIQFLFLIRLCGSI